MAVEVYANQPSTTVTSGGTDAPVSGTPESWTVASSASFPAAATGVTQFHVTDTAAGAISEIIAVTNVSGTTWTVTRGAESTTPLAHNAGFTITQVVTAGALGSLLASANDLSDVASAPTARTNLGLAAQQVSSPSGSYAASYGDQIPVTLGTTTGIVLPAASGAGTETIGIAAVSGTGTATVTATGAGALSAAVSPIVNPVLSSPLSTGGPITSIPVNALSAAVAAGTVTIAPPNTSSETQVFITTGAAAGATSIPCTSVTPNYAYPTTSYVTAAASVTTLPVNALPAAISAGSVIMTSGTVSQVLTTTGASQGATSVTVTAATPVTYFPAGSAVAGSGSVLSGFYGQSASIPAGINDQFTFRAFGSVWGYTSPPAQLTTAPGAPGTTPWNLVLYAPVKWAFINYNVVTHDLGNTYIYAYAGAGGVGDTITAGSNGILTVDTGHPSVGDRLVVADPYAHGAGLPPHPDGIYVVTSAGSGGSPWVLTRSPDCNTIAALFQYWAVEVTAGALFGGGFASVSALSAISGAQNYVPGGTFIRLQVSTLGAIAIGPSNTAVSASNTPQQGFTAAIGTQATAIGSGSVAVGNTSYASGTYAHTYGFTSAATGYSAHSLGSFTQASGYQGTALGVSSSGGTPNCVAQASGNISVLGDAQQFLVCVFAKTTDATPTALASSHSKTIILVNYQASNNYQKTMLFTANIVARRTDTPGTDSVWSMQGVLRGNGSSTYSWVGGSAPTSTLIAQDAAASSWTVTAAVATNVVTFTVTGETGNTIVWNAACTITEVSG